MYIKEIEILENHRCFSKGQKFEFQQITFLVGDQGCGKSTLLKGLQEQSKFLKVVLTPEGMKGVEFFYFDTEKMNPRITDPNNYANMDGTNRGIGFGNALLSRFGSHGEILVDFTVNALKKAENCIVFLDEPESGLSLRNQYNLWDEIENAAKRNCQIVVSTHSLVLINAVPAVLSLEHKEWMESSKFVELMKEKKHEPKKHSQLPFFL